MTALRGKIFYASDIARVLEWSTERATRWLRKPRNSERETLGYKDGGRWATTVSRIIALAPEAWEEMREAIESDQD